MKKFLLSSLVLAAASISASAAAPDQLYLIGGPAGWDPTFGLECTAQGDGVFVINDIVMDGTSYFAFTSELGDWNVVNANRVAPDEKDKPFVLDAPNAFVLGQDASWKIDGGQYSFMVDFNNNTVTASGEAYPTEPTPEPSDEVIYLIGDMQGWNITGAEYPIFKVEEGIYEATYPFGALNNQYFRFYRALGNWNADSYGPLPDDETNVPVEFVDNLYSSDLVAGKGSWVIESFEGGNIYFKVDFNEMKATFAIGEVADGIDSIAADNNGEEVIYNLQGVRVNRQNAAPGLYIVNGKKVVLK